ncbi:MAG TPA: ABC transporter ATP-binding protein [Limnobacter sp.]|uniref:ABC transporter ATP-binding protein n=1 Tax=Limnobacter sp. TaxID=2003368 RepID=UPI002EDA0072
MSSVQQGLFIELSQAHPMRLHGAFSCQPGELLVLVGPSGAGKSSMLRVMAGLMRPDAGHMRVQGEVWMDLQAGVFKTPQARRVGMVFQHYALMPHLSAIDNVALALMHLPKVQQRAEAIEWLSRVKLTGDEIHRKPAGLSGGQQQRVAMARALARRPQLLLLDEPFSAVDSMNRQALYALLADLRQSLNIPMVLVTHDLQEARHLGDKLVVLDGGEVLQEGAPAEVHQRPRNSRVADLVGIQNRFHGRWLGAGQASGTGLLQWLEKPDATESTSGPVLQVSDKGKIPANFPVSWVVHADALELHHTLPVQRLGDASTEVLPVEVVQLRDLGELSLVELALADHPALHFRLVVSGPQRPGLRLGLSLWVCMNLQAVHIMPKKSGQNPAAVSKS